MTYILHRFISICRENWHMQYIYKYTKSNTYFMIAIHDKAKSKVKISANERTKTKTSQFKIKKKKNNCRHPIPCAILNY